MRKAANQGYAVAQNYLGSLLETKKEYKAAIKYYVLVANQNDVQACTNLGYLYQQGTGVKKDADEAIKWTKKAADLGYSVAQNNVGYLFEMKKEYKEALKYYTLAANQGEAFACNNLGYLYQQGIGAEKDEKLSKEWFEKGQKEFKEWKKARGI